MLVYNNRSSGMDRELLERYREPSWNFQVIRFLDADGKDEIPGKGRFFLYFLSKLELLFSFLSLILTLGLS